MTKLKAGDTFNGYIVGKVYEWLDHYDLDLINKETGKRGFIRIKK